MVYVLTTAVAGAATPNTPVVTDGTITISANVGTKAIAYVSGSIDSSDIQAWETSDATAVVKATVNGDTYTGTTKVTSKTTIADLVNNLKLPTEISSIGSGYKVNVSVELTFKGNDSNTYTVAGATVIYS